MSLTIGILRRLFSSLKIATPFVLALMATGSPATAASDEPTAHFDTGLAQQWIPFERKPDGVIFITVELNGAPVRALIDTGFPDVTISHAYAVAHHLALENVGSGHSVGGSTRLDRTGLASLRVGGISQTGGILTVVDLSYLSRAASEPIDLVLGNSLLSRVALQVDFDNHRLRLLPSGARPITGTDVPVDFRSNGNRTMTQITIAGQVLKPILIDMGDDGLLNLANGTWSTNGHGRRPSTDIAVTGAGGIEVRKLTTLAAIGLGDLRATSVTAQIEAPGGFSDHGGWAGAIGLGFLSRYNFVLDVTARRMTLTSRRHPEPEEAKSTIGVQGLYAADRMKLVHIMAASPAAAAGLRPGDAICAVNGRHVEAGWQDSPTRKWSTVKPGTPVSIALCDGRQVKLTSAAFY